MSIEFPLPTKETALGRLSDPKIPVQVSAAGGQRVVRSLIDTGADCSMAPRRLAQEAGLNWDLLTEIHVTGVGQGGVASRLGQIRMRIGEVELLVRCLFVDSPVAPFILGRADFLDRFVLTIDQPNRKIILETPSPNA